VKILSIVSAKGGVGKTTISANLCSALRSKGHTVFALDLDPQNSLRLHFGITPSHHAGVALSTLSASNWAKAMVQGNEGCVVLPFGHVSESERITFESALSKDPLLLDQQLRSLGLPQDAIVIIDTPPGPSVYLKQALLVANIAIVVTLADAASYATIPMIDSLIEQYCFNRADFIDYLYVINQLNRSRQLSSDVADIMALQFSNKNISIVHQDQSIPEALACNQDALAYAPESQGAHDLIDFAMLINTILNDGYRAPKNEKLS